MNQSTPEPVKRKRALLESNPLGIAGWVCDGFVAGGRESSRPRSPAIIQSIPPYLKKLKPKSCLFPNPDCRTRTLAAFEVLSETIVLDNLMFGIGKMKRLLLSALVLLPLATQALAYIQAGPSRLDHAIWPEHDPKLIVAGTINAIHPNDPNVLPPWVGFRFSVQDVILGDQKYKDQELYVPVSVFIWPSDLVPFKKATRCILVLRTGWEKPDGYYLKAVVPASGKQLPVARDGVEAKRILMGEILAVLQGEKLQERQRALLLQLAPILTKEHAREVVPFVKSKNIWVMRAALTALIYATEEDQYIQRMATDVQRFFTTTKPSERAPAGSVVAYAPDGSIVYSSFFDHYFFLEKRSWTWGSRWNEDEANKDLRLLNTMFDTGIISDEVKKILNPEQKNATEKK